MYITTTQDKALKEEILTQLKENGGYCPCRLIKTEDTKCMCKDFREQEEGTCHCGLYIKVKGEGPTEMNYNDIVSNVRIYDLEESLIASGYPMRVATEIRNIDENDIKRGQTLVNATKNGNGAHSQFLTGIRVSFDLTCTNKMWVEAERYRFLEFVSSQSTMHRITKFDLDNQYIEYVDPRVVSIMKQKVKSYNSAIENKRDPETIKRKYLEILYTNPAGFKITARMTTNYRCLRNIYIQRKDHRLPEWRAFCKWIETLPYAEEFLIN